MMSYLHSLKSKKKGSQLRRYSMMAVFLMLALITASAQIPIISRTECGCLNNEFQAGDGQFAESITITGAPGVIWKLESVSGLFSTLSPAPPAAPIALVANHIIPEITPGNYVLNSRRVDNSNYSVVITNGTLRIPLTSAHTCRYPRKDIIGDFGACVDSDFKTYRLDLANSMLTGVNWSISGGGSIVGSTSTNTLKVNWGNVLGSYNVGVVANARAYPGQASGLCSINESEVVDIADENAVALACNNLVNLSMNGRCELSITPDMILEEMLLPSTSYDVVLRDIQRDTIIPNTRISQSYINKTIEVKIVQECSGNSCWGLVKLEDKSIPSLVCGPDVTIDCNQLTGPNVTGYPLKPDAIVTPISGNKFLVKNFDYCSDVVLQYFDEIKASDCVGPFSSVVTRTWLATDISGNKSTCSSDIYIRKANSVDIVFPSNYDDVLGPNPSLDACGTFPRLPNGNPDPSFTGRPTGVFCLNVTVDFQDTKIPKCRGEKTFKLIRKWIVTDLCNASQIIRNQTITVMDTKPPVVVAPNDFTVGTEGLTCASAIKVPPPIIVYECSNYEYHVSYKVPDPTGTPTGTGITDGIVKNADGTYTITTVPAGVTRLWISYLVIDDCDNASEVFTEVDIKDSTPPVPVCDQFSFAGLNDDGVGYVTTESLDDGSWDNCALDYLEARRMETTSCGITNNWGPKIKFCCEDVGKAFMVQLRVVDKAGNSNVCMVEVRVQDNVPPQLINCPANITVDCTADLLSLSQYGSPTVFDVCGATLTEEKKENGFDDCGRGSIARVFTATDANGNKTSCTQTITVKPTTPFNANNIKWPQDHTFTNGCLSTGLNPDAMPAGKQRPTWDIKQCSHIAAEYEDLVFQYVEGFCFKVLRKWTVIDWCQFNPLNLNEGRWTFTQVIKGQNSVPPTITKGCSIGDFKITQIENCKALLEATATGTDDCTLPEKLIWSYSLDVDNNGTVDFTGTNNAISRSVGFGKHNVKWTVTDECGNSKTCATIVEVKDSKKPTPYCLSEITTVIMEEDGSVEIWASDFNAGSYDNCSPNPNLKYSFSSNINEKSHEFTCAEMITSTTRFELKIYVTDDAGNQDYCTTHINIQDNNNTCGLDNITNEGEETRVAVSGNITTESLEAIEDVTVKITSDQAEFPKFVTSATDGSYTFNDLTMYADYTVTPTKTDDYLNGVSTLDLVLIQRHILGVKKLDSPYKIIASDANSDNKVSANDLVVLRKLILGLYDKLPNSDSWKFVDKTQVFVNPEKPFPFQQQIGMNTIDHNVANSDFVAVKIGDVNGSFQQLRSGVVAENRSSQALQYSFEGARAGTLVEVPFENIENRSLAGLQLSMVFDETKFEFVGVKNINQGISEDEVYLINNNNVLISWVNNHENANSIGNLFTLVFKAKQDVEAYEFLNINKAGINSEVYTAEEDLVITNGLDIELKGRNGNAAQQFELYQNTPNPFNHNTTIGFMLPESGEVSFKVYDYDGVVYKQFKKHYEKGYNIIELNINEFNKAGILFYQLDSKTQSANKKMIVIR